jgi:TrmH family RNA methyltransferase
MPSDSSFRRVASRQNAVVARARQLARGGTPDEVLIEGATLLDEALAAGWSVNLVAITDEARSDPAVRRLLERVHANADRVLVSSTVMEAMSPVRSPSGVLAIGTVPNPGTAPRRRTVPPLVVCAIDVQDPGNLGAIVRVAEAAGATEFIAAGASADPFSWKALRGAMGSAFRLPLTRHLPVDEALALARSRGCRVAATVLDGTPVDRADLAGPLCVCVGSEGSGLPPAVVGSADQRLTIPMASPVESLNVAAATAIVLYEIRRQRQHGPSAR